MRNKSVFFFANLLAGQISQTLSRKVMFAGVNANIKP